MYLKVAEAAANATRRRRKVFMTCSSSRLNLKTLRKDFWP
jgi:hypothetical protein